METVGTLINFLLFLYLILLIARLVLDYIQLFARSWSPTGPVLVVAEATYTATDPPLRALRRIIPPLRIGRVSLDLSFLVLIIAVQVVMLVVVPAIFF